MSLSQSDDGHACCNHLFFFSILTLPPAVLFTLESLRTTVVQFSSSSCCLPCIPVRAGRRGMSTAAVRCHDVTIAQPVCDVMLELRLSWAALKCYFMGKSIVTRETTKIKILSARTCQVVCSSEWVSEWVNCIVLRLVAYNAMWFNDVDEQLMTQQ